MRIVVLLTSLLMALAPAARAQDELPELTTALLRATSAFGAGSALPWIYQEISRTVEPDVGGVVYLELRDRTSGVRVPGIVEWAVVRPDGADWRVWLPGDPGYTDALRDFPRWLRVRFDDTPYRPLPNGADEMGLTLTDYRLPWEDGAWGTVTRSFAVHGRGKLDVDLAGRRVAAAKRGTVIYASDGSGTNGYARGAWWYWNAVVVEHGPYEYTLYGHLEPGSVPESILATCVDDLSAQNCNAPVEAGAIIGREGNTGYSFRPHLHFEAGQSFQVVPYPDTMDGDEDGDRTELVYAADVYREHDIAFLGYTADDVAAWAYGRLEQAAHQLDVTAGENLVANGDFSAGTDGWLPSGQINWQVADGVLRVLRLRTSDPPDWASFYQDLGIGAPANFPVEIRLDLGNVSGVAKEVAVTLRNADGWEYGAFTCRFALVPGAPLRSFVARGRTTGTWAELRLEIGVNPPDSAPAALVDNIRVTHVPDADWSETECE